MERAEAGVRIAEETAHSLTEIVSGISESGKLVSQISESSQEQSTAIAQVNIGIDQVAQVVQQNSATAQESAAASEEMSSQSALLRELVSQFKIKGSGQEATLPSLRTAVGLQDGSGKYEKAASRDGFGKY
jgi:methyl-accepting chemotaxis protein